MSRTRRYRTGLSMWLTTASLAGSAAVAPSPLLAESSEGLEFFENRIRPLLAEHCYSCHSSQAEQLKASLYLDTREGWRRGGESGPAIVPGDPEASLLIKAIRHTDPDLKMPKDGKLTDQQIADLEAWVKMGAPDPRDGSEATPADRIAEQARQHWAFQPVQQPEPPAVRDAAWVQTPVDRFVLAELETRGIRPAPPADRRTLIRRASYGLLGLPPTAEEVDQFATDDSPEAYPQLIERLLSSQHYGERWARYWLDIARYADTKGYVFTAERLFPYSYTYRDYVIRSFNEDLPFDRFVVEQLAADLLPLGEDKRPLAALGFLTLGRRFLNNQHDIIDDRIDVVARGTMGLTVACARCHDHKYDPVSTRDYYALYGVFASSTEPDDKPLLGTASLPQEYPEFMAEQKRRQDELDSYQIAKELETRRRIRGEVGDYLLAAHDASKVEGEEKQENLVRERKLDFTLAKRWMSHLEKAESSPVLGPWLVLAGAGDFQAGLDTLASGEAAVHPAVKRLLETDPPGSLAELATRYNKLFASVDQAWEELLKSAEPQPAKFEDADQETLRQILYAEDSPLSLDHDALVRLYDVPSREKIRALERDRDKVEAIHPGAPPRAMALVDRAKPHEPHVFLRGSPSRRGPEVPRQFLEFFPAASSGPFTNGSGRLELAQAIANTNNPLTARVWVNRVWTYHFGKPLVSTPSDFGLRADPPSNQAMLDYLASRFMAEGWSVKSLHRLILLSSAYQQSTQFNPDAARIDPENQLVWRMNRRRLDFEALRDTLLSVSGQLDPAAYGRSVDITAEPFPRRRTVYAFIERQNLPGLFRAFDFANPDSTSPQRFDTTVPQQALFLMNSPFAIEQARQFLQRSEARNVLNTTERLRVLWRLAYQRAPDPQELAWASGFVEELNPSAPPPVATAWSYGYARYDAERQRTRRFRPLPHYTGSAYQGGNELPDSQLGWTHLTATGGHPGGRHPAVRRWTAPYAGRLQISSQLKHGDNKGDGVRGRIVSAQGGLLGEGTAFNRAVTINLDSVEIAAGETLDFVVDCLTEESFDSFAWAPVIRYHTDASQARDQRAQWEAATDFDAPPSSPATSLTRWEELAQILLLSNEMCFVD